MTKVRNPEVAPLRHSDKGKDRRRPGRIDNVSPALIPLLRHPTGRSVAGDLAPVDRFQVVAAWTASAYPADIWLSMSETERAQAIDRELRKLDAAHAARSASV
jgi:hypothetical protein